MTTATPGRKSGLVDSTDAAAEDGHRMAGEPRQMRQLSVSLASFVVAWLACVLGAAQGWPMLGPLVVGVQLALSSFRMRDPRREVGFAATVAVIGTAVETGWLGIGMYGVAELAAAEPGRSLVLCPLWMTALWFSFGRGLQGWLGVLAGKPVAAALFGAVAGPGAYLAADSVQAILLLWPAQQSLPALAIAWAGLLPGLLYLANLPVYRPQPLSLARR